jgi:hypothetical protein
MQNKKTNFDTKYILLDTDRYLIRMVHIPNYWKIRDKGAAFSPDNVEGGDKGKDDLVITGLTNHLVIISIGGAHYHLNLLENFLNKNLPPRDFEIWQELIPFYSNLFGAREGLSKFCFFLLCEDAKPENIEEIRYKKIMKFLKKEHKDLYNIFRSIDQNFALRHKLQHVYMTYIRIVLVKNGSKPNWFEIPKNPKIIQNKVLPRKDVDYENGLTIMKESLSFIEGQINQVYDYLLSGKYIERFLKQKNLIGVRL